MKRSLTFIALAYLISWIIWFPLWAPKIGLASSWEPSILQHAFGGLGPLLAGAITASITKKNGLLEWLKQFTLLPFKPLAFAIFIPYLFLFSLMLVLKEFNFEAAFSSREFPFWSYGWVILYNFVFFGLGEEGGWSGILRTEFRKIGSYPIRILMLSLIWAVWHWPLFLYRPGYESMGIGGILGWYISLLTGAVILQYLFDWSKGSVAVCAVFHCTIDLAFTTNLKNDLITNGLGMLITILGIILFGIEYKKWKNTKLKPN